MTYTANRITGAVRVSDKLLVAQIGITWTTRRRNTATALRREMNIGSLNKGLWEFADSSRQLVLVKEPQRALLLTIHVQKV